MPSRLAALSQSYAHTQARARAKGPNYTRLRGYGRQLPQHLEERMLDDLFAADALSQRALDLLFDRDAAEEIDIMQDADAVAANTLATLAVAKRLSVVADQLAELTRSLDRIGLDGINRDLHAERCARDRAEAELARLDAAEAEQGK